ncbi:MAG: hypothetical protein P8J55_01945 [Pseudomonadales bacterium]|nr:hypothetical protein [Pseudomonadales bacterium]
MMHIIRTVIVFILLSVTMFINQEDNLFARLGMQGNYVALIALIFLFALLLSNRSFHIVAMAALLSLAANMPAEFSLNFGLDRDLFSGFMVAPFIEYHEDTLSKLG